MLTEKRHEIICDMLSQHDIVTLQQLTDTIGSSESTIRRDLSALEEKGQLIRVHGGAKQVADLQDTQLEIKTTRFVREKDEIAKHAAALINDGACIYLDAGSSTLAMIPYLTQQNLTVITNSVIHVTALVERGIKTIMIGGFVKQNTMANVGCSAEEMLKTFNFNLAFIGVNGVDADKGLTTPDPEEAAIKRLAINQSVKSYYLADESKFDQVTFATITPLSEGSIITNHHSYNNQYNKYIKVG
ncbi:DeoR/GlpR family DNA-binding transcription regulator [Macrococcus brunensis]|uniref:DeoR/GlpR family DNA-binding transcription regulator n=1 Tax=Macrococcus brunensis TaxID=198483 RepID=UPI001EEF9556|nr:DeoR/GlpR family DNA-binding transcription regulator [Macrococcus brunensis]ULG74742.1 DeoR/GlpR family DNA-binding transcription regulator [Macrococcus brunensis]